jgi:hypothetical protein
MTCAVETAIFFVISLVLHLLDGILVVENSWLLFTLRERLSDVDVNRGISDGAVAQLRILCQLVLA